MGAERTDQTTSTPFAARMSVEQVEEGFALAPRFDADGLIPCITTDANAGEVLMLHEAAMRARLDACLLDERLAAADSETWAELRNPFPELRTAEESA